MGDALRGAVPHAHDKTAWVCQSIPGHFLSAGNIAGAGELLSDLADIAGTDGWLPTKLGTGVHTRVPDALTHFWFAQASFCYLRISKDQAMWAEKLLPFIKRIAHSMISGAFEGTTMNDGGVLMGIDEDALFVNALWYNLMGILAEQLPIAGDRAGDHFERLAGRFRRSYLKAYWCDQHGCLCDAQVKLMPEHASPDYLPPSSQVVNATLPFSAIPRTKQRTAIDAVRKNGQLLMGMLVGGNTVEAAHARHHHGGEVLPILLTWMAEGHVRTSDTPASAVAEAIAWMTPLKEHIDLFGTLADHYKMRATPETQTGKPHGPTMAETARVWRWLKEAAERPLGNSKRTRIAD